MAALANEDFASAALRHVRDAQHLLEAGPHLSPDQAWHLAGFAHECARKACLCRPEDWLAKVLGHDFDEVAEIAIDFAMALDARASRVPVRDWRAVYPGIADWRPNHRYERTGHRSFACARELVLQAREGVDKIIIALYLNGRIAPESLEV